jgi:hypothetical protein
MASSLTARPKADANGPFTAPAPRNTGRKLILIECVALARFRRIPTFGSLRCCGLALAGIGVSNRLSISRLAANISYRTSSIFFPKSCRFTRPPGTYGSISRTTSLCGRAGRIVRRDFCLREQGSADLAVQRSAVFRGPRRNAADFKQRKPALHLLYTIRSGRPCGWRAARTLLLHDWPGAEKAGDDSNLISRPPRSLVVGILRLWRLP